MTHDDDDIAPEPIFIRQTRLDPALQFAWLDRTVAEAHKRGCGFMRVTNHPKDIHLVIFEGWDRDYVRNQGYARWLFEKDVVAAAHKWQHARSKMLELPMGSPDFRAALDALSDAENELQLVVKGAEDVKNADDRPEQEKTDG